MANPPMLGSEIGWDMVVNQASLDGGCIVLFYPVLYSLLTAISWNGEKLLQFTNLFSFVSKITPFFHHAFFSIFAALTHSI